MISVDRRQICRGFEGIAVSLSLLNFMASCLWPWVMEQKHHHLCKSSHFPTCPDTAVANRSHCSLHFHQTLSSCVILGRPEVCTAVYTSYGDYISFHVMLWFSKRAPWLTAYSFHVGCIAAAGESNMSYLRKNGSCKRVMTDLLALLYPCYFLLKETQPMHCPAMHRYTRKQLTTTS